jgi:transposase
LRRLNGSRSFTQAFCWSHVRRKFIEAERSCPREAAAVINLIDELFAIEKLCKTGPPQHFDGDRLAWTLHLRQQRSEPVLAALKVWGQTKLALGSTSFGKAQSYMMDLWDGLVRFVDDPNVAVDNNASERALRGLVIGRKNHYGSKSVRGTEVAAVLYSVLESAKLAGVNPADYMHAAVTSVLLGDEPLLPHQYAGSVKSS